MSKGERIMLGTNRDDSSRPSVAKATGVATASMHNASRGGFDMSPIGGAKNDSTNLKDVV